MTSLPRILLLPWILQLAACAGLPSQQSAPTPPPAEAEFGSTAEPGLLPEPQINESGELSGPMLFDILLGEVAGQRNRLDISVDHYLRAAESAQDPRIAERALRIALFAKQEDAALTAARRWVELDPQRLEARQSLAMLAIHARIADEAYEQLEFLVTAGGDGASFQTVTGLLARSEDRELALALMARLTQSHPNSAEAHLAYSRLALHAENTDLALSEAEQALLLRPDWTDALVMRAGVRVKAGDTPRARQELETAIAAQPKDIELRLAFARLLLDTQDLPAARAQFAQVLKVQPEHADALFSMALLSIEDKDYKDAEGYLRKLLKTGKREQEANYYLGRVLELRKDSRAALDWYGRVTEGDYWLEAQVRAVNLRAELGELDAARRQLQSLRLRDPRLAVRLYLVEGDLLSRAGQTQQAMDLYNSVLAEVPNNHDLLYARALLAEKLDDLAMTERDLRQIINEDPNNFHALNALGYTLADRTDRLQEAVELIQKALELAPDEAAIVDSMGWAQFRLGNAEAAVEHLRRAYKLSNEDPEVAAHLGEVLWQQGQQAEARALWEKARKAHPDNKPLQNTLQRLLP